MGSSVNILNGANLGELRNVFKDVCVGGVMRSQSLDDHFQNSIKDFSSSLTFTPANVTDEYRRFLSNGGHCPDGITVADRKFMLDTFRALQKDIQRSFLPSDAEHLPAVDNLIDVLKRPGRFFRTVSNMHVLGFVDENRLAFFLMKYPYLHHGVEPRNVPLHLTGTPEDMITFYKGMAEILAPLLGMAGQQQGIVPEAYIDHLARKLNKGGGEPEASGTDGTSGTPSTPSDPSPATPAPTGGSSSSAGIEVIEELDFSKYITAGAAQLLYIPVEEIPREAIDFLMKFLSDRKAGIPYRGSDTEIPIKVMDYLEHHFSAIEIPYRSQDVEISIEDTDFFEKYITGGAALLLYIGPGAPIGPASSPPVVPSPVGGASPQTGSMPPVTPAPAGGSGASAASIEVVDFEVMGDKVSKKSGSSDSRAARSVAARSVRSGYSVYWQSPAARSVGLISPTTSGVTFRPVVPR